MSLKYKLANEIQSQTLWKDFKQRLYFAFFWFCVCPGNGYEHRSEEKGWWRVSALVRNSTAGLFLDSPSFMRRKEEIGKGHSTGYFFIINNLIKYFIYFRLTYKGGKKNFRVHTLLNELSLARQQSLKFQPSSPLSSTICTSHNLE